MKKEELYKVAVFDKKFATFKALDHPHLNKIQEIYDDNEHFYLVSDYINGGDLFTALRKRQKAFTEKDVASVVK